MQWGEKLNIFCGECDYKKLLDTDRYILSRFSFLKRRIIGYSACLRAIYSYTVGGDDGVIMCGAFHSMERITAMFLMKFLEEVSYVYEKSDSFRKKLDDTGLTIVPMVNPDGVEISLYGEKTAYFNEHSVKRMIEQSKKPHTCWQANAHGVDINHNFNAGFKHLRDKEIKGGYILPTNTRFGGAFPESESETRAVTRLCRSHSYSLAVAMHTQGREIYYDYGENTPKESKIIAQQLEKLSGYVASQPEDIATGGGFKDWFIERFRRPAFTIEAGLGKNPLSPEIFDDEYKLVRKMLWKLLLSTRQ